MASALQLTLPTASRQLQQLERMGFVARRPDPADGRVVTYACTSAGRAAQRRFRTVIRREVRRALARWDASDRTELAGLLERMVADFRATGTLMADVPRPTAVSALAGSVALIAGAGEGIGRSCALAFARAGADVVVGARTAARLEAIAAEIEALGRRAVADAHRLTDGAQVDRLVGPRSTRSVGSTRS